MATLNSQKVAVRAVAKWYEDGRPDGKPLVKEVGSGAFVCPTYPTTQRSSGPCVQKQCLHWTTHCRLGAVIAGSVNAIANDSPLRDCGIEQTCRWRAENGDVICRTCDSLSYQMPLGND